MENRRFPHFSEGEQNIVSIPEHIDGASKLFLVQLGKLLIMYVVQVDIHWQGR